MLISNRWYSGTALLMALGITSATAAPLLMSAPATAGSEPYLVGQLFTQQPSSARVAAGTVIPVTYDEAERIIVTPDETAPVTLTVTAAVRSSAGTVLIPAGSQIEGELQPADGGTQFVAEEVVFANNDRRYSIDATSQVITETETITEDSDPDILRGAVIGAAAAAVLSDIFGDIDLIDVLAGAGIGSVAEILLAGEDEAEVVVVNPETDLDLVLQSDFVLSNGL